MQCHDWLAELLNLSFGDGIVKYDSGLNGRFSIMFHDFVSGCLVVLGDNHM